MTTTPASTQTPALDRFFGSLRRSSITRSQNRVIAGVCAGIANRFGVSAAIVRVGAVVLTLFGPGVFLYLLAWLLLPRYDGQIRLERAVRGGDASSIVLLVVALLCAWQVLSGLLGGEIFTGAAGRALWIRWPNVPDLFMRAMLFYGIGFVVGGACAGVIGYGLLDAARNRDDRNPG